MPANRPVGAQLAAVESAASHLLVLAPPGCGKTEVLAMRADYLIRNGFIRPGHRLLAVTFTNRARDNLSVRLRQQLGDQRMRQSVSVMNFHELSARLVEAHHKAIALDPGYSMPVKAWQRKVIAALTSDKREGAAALELLSSLKREPVTDHDLLEQVKASGNAVALAYEQRRQDERYIDYGDLLRYAQLILRNLRVAALFQDHFDSVLVDEFQDLSLQQYELTRLIGTRNSMFVGDPYQGIFGWAGAEPERVHADLKTRVEEIIELDVSFRSSPAVLEVVNSISASLGSAALKAASPDEWVGGGHAYAAGYAIDSAEATGIVALTDYLAAQYPDDRIGVICRAAYRRGALERAYDAAASPPQFWDIALDTPRIGRLLRLHARQVDATASIEDQLHDLRDRVVASLDPADIDTIGEVGEACEQLADFYFEGATARVLVERIRDHQTLSLITPGVHVLNAHVGKGQQFDWVVVMGLEEGHVPSSYSKTQEALLEDQRVLLVMLSRARKGLFLTYALKNQNQWGKVFLNQPSRWWAGMEAASKPMTAEVASILKLPS
jgi:DNA helicase-2/ATP-dependent DNA helicase PcrA